MSVINEIVYYILGCCAILYIAWTMSTVVLMLIDIYNKILWLLGFDINNKIKKDIYPPYFPMAGVKNQSRSKLICSFANFLSSSSVLFNIAPMHTRNILHKLTVTIF